MQETSTSDRSGCSHISPFDKRKGQLPIPLNLRDFLNQDQMLSLRQMENFGWRLVFIRRPDNRPYMAVVYSGDSRQYGILETDGSINTNTTITIRPH